MTTPAPHPHPTVAGQPDMNVCFRVLGPLPASNGQPIPCRACGRPSGPWLLIASPTDAWMTCEAGHRNSHPDITAAWVWATMDGCEGSWPSVEAAEAWFTARPADASHTPPGPL